MILRVAACTAALAISTADDAVNLRLERATQVFGCEGSDEVDQQHTAKGHWGCIWKKLFNSQFPGYQEEVTLGKAGIYGEISPLGLARFVDELGVLLPSGLAGESFFDLGSGAGKVVLHAALGWDVASATGVELGQKRCDIAQAALGKAQQFLAGAQSSEDISFNAAFVCGDVLEVSLEGASVIFMNSICFPKVVLLGLARRLAEILPAGTLVLSSAGMPGCHRGLNLLRTVNLEGTNSTPSLYHVYAVMPRLPPALEEPAGRWALDFKSPEVQEAIARKAREIAAEDEETSASERSATSTRLRIALRAEDGAGLPLPEVERALAMRVVGNSGSVLKCYTEELMHSLQIDDGGAEALLDGLRAATTRMEPLRDTHGDAALHIAAAAWSTAAVNFLLEAGMDANVRSPNGDTPLFVAVKSLQNAVESSMALLEHRADVNAVNALGATALHTAAFYGRLPAAQVLLEARADPAARNDDGETPMHRAAKAGEVELLELLADAGADVCSTDAKGCTPLHAAATKGREQALGALLDLNPSCITVADATGELALHKAASYRSGAGAVRVLVGSAGETTLVRNHQGETPLHLASAKGYATLVDELLVL